MENKALAAGVPHRPPLPAARPAPEPGDHWRAGREPRRQGLPSTRREGPLHRDGVCRAPRGRGACARHRGAFYPILFSVEVPFFVGDEAFLSIADGRETPTSPSTSSPGWSSSRSFARSKGPWLRAARHWASATSGPPRRCASATCSGPGSPPSGTRWTRTAPSRSATRPRSSAEQPRPRGLRLEDVVLARQGLRRAARHRGGDLLGRAVEVLR